MKLVYSMLYTLSLTLLIELGVAICIRRTKRFVITVILCNIITNPMLQILLYLINRVGIIPYPLALLSFEVVVIGVEAYIMYYINKNALVDEDAFTIRNAVWSSIALNVSSFVIGELLKVV